MCQLWKVFSSFFSSYNTQHLNIICQDIIETKRDSLKASFFINVCVYWLKQEIMVPSHGSLPGQLKNFPLRIHSFHFAENVPALLPVFLVLASYISPS